MDLQQSLSFISTSTCTLPEISLKIYTIELIKLLNSFRLGRLSKESVQFRGFMLGFVTGLFFTVSSW
jgi:hypothetical protein